jgi:hypothetical protein
MAQGGSSHKSINYIDKVNLMNFKLQAFEESFFNYCIVLYLRRCRKQVQKLQPSHYQPDSGWCVEEKILLEFGSKTDLISCKPIRLPVENNKAHYQ